MIRDTCAHLGRLDRADGLTCTLCPTGPCRALQTRQPLLTRDHWLLLAVLLTLAALLVGAFLIGQDSRCDRLTDSGNPAAATYCPQDTP